MTLQVGEATRNYIVNALSGAASVPTGGVLGSTANALVLLSSGSSILDANTNSRRAYVMSQGKYAAVNAGVMALTSGPLSTSVYTSTGTVVEACVQALNSPYTRYFQGSAGLAGSGADFIVSDTGVAAPQIVNASFYLPSEYGSLAMSLSLRDDLLSAFMLGTAAPALGASGTLSLYTGTPPVYADSAPTGTLLATLALGATSPWDAAVGGLAALTAPLTTANAVASGLASYFRITKGAYTMQGTVGTFASGADCIVQDTNASVGSPLVIVSMPIQALG